MNERVRLLSLRRVGYVISYIGIFIILLWIGIFKFTPTEAKSILRLVENQPLMSWLYNIFGEQGVSNLIGIIEVATAVMMLFALRWKLMRKIAAIMIIVTFVLTLSFLFTTPGIWRVIDGVPVTDFFILKDLPLLGIGFILLSD